MLNYNFVNSEEELLHVIRTRGTTFEDYRKVVEKIQNINYTDDNDYSFLHEAVCERKMDVAVDLLQRGIDVDIQNVNGYTAAQLAAVGQQWEMLEEILKYRPNVNLKDWRYGTNLLWEVVAYKSEERNRIARKLLDMGANPYSENRDGKSPLDLVTIIGNEELIEAFGRVERPLQEEPEKFRVPKRGSGFFTVKMRDYTKFICVEDTTMEYLQEKILDYATIAGGKKKEHSFKLVPIEGSRWIIICCPKGMDFYNYHNLMSWIWGTAEDVKKPRQTICVAAHVDDARLSYYAIMDKLSFNDDHMVGRFQNGESFYIYLPDAYKKDGNAKSYRDYLPIKMIGQYLEICGLDEAWLDKAADLPGAEMEVEMAV